MGTSEPAERGKLQNATGFCAGFGWLRANPLLRDREGGHGGARDPPVRGSLLLGLFLARPGARRVGEGGPHAAVHGHLGAAEYGALERPGGDHLAPRRVAVLALRRIVVVEQGPDLLEELIAEEARGQAADDA